MLILACDQCRAPIERRPSRVRGERAFCGKKCEGDWRRNRDLHGVPTKTPAVERPCAHCTTPFTPLPVQVRNGHGKYCSRACAGQGKRKKNDFEYTTRMAWYLSLGWARISRKLRAEVGACACGAAEDLEVHHVKDPFPTRDRRLALDRENLVVCCSTCHHRQHQPGVEVECRRCGGRFRVKPARREKARYCGQECYRAERAEARASQ